ncbi:MAG: hypothetical protein ACR2NZ_21745, partial [Rubripirellula sp.]
ADEWAVRRGDWKLHRTKGKLELVNLVDDPSETKNLAKSNAGKVKELGDAYDEWIKGMADPITGGAKRNDVSKDSPASAQKQELTAREIKRAKIREQRRAEKKAAREKE